MAGKGFLSLFNEPERVLVTDDGEFWIDIKTSLTAEDYEHAQRVLFGKMAMHGADLSATPDTISYQHELVFRAIVNWNLTDEDGDLLPLEPEKAKHDSIRRIPQSIFVDLYQRVNQASSARTGGDELQFRDDGSTEPSRDESLNGKVPVAAEVSD
jgi:hypothetical protein